MNKYTFWDVHLNGHYKHTIEGSKRNALLTYKKQYPNDTVTVEPTPPEQYAAYADIYDDYDLEEDD